ncbi:MAG: hypothetical protein QM778_33895 [Myxococcales bacterium]
MAFRLTQTFLVLNLSCLALGCGRDADETYAGMSSLVVEQPDGIGYRLRYVDPPWQRVTTDPLERGQPDASVQFGRLDRVGAPALPDLVPSKLSSRVLEIHRTAQVDMAAPGVITYPKYRLEVSVLNCDELGVQVATQDSCAKKLNTSDSEGRTGAELNTFFGADGREGKNDKGQPYYEFMTQVQETARYRRVVYYETSKRMTAIRLGFEANPPLSELEVTQMINAFEVLEGEAADLSDGEVPDLDAGSLGPTDGGTSP